MVGAATISSSSGHGGGGRGACGTGRAGYVAADYEVAEELRRLTGTLLAASLSTGKLGKRVKVAGRPTARLPNPTTTRVAPELLYDRHHDNQNNLQNRQNNPPGPPEPPQEYPNRPTENTELTPGSQRYPAPEPAAGPLEIPMKLCVISVHVLALLGLVP